MDNILEKIHKATLQFLVPMTPEETYSTIGREAVKLVGGEHSTIYLEENGDLVRVFSSHPDLFRIESKRRDVRYRVFRSHTPVVLSLDYMRKLKKRYPFMGDLYNRSAIIIPLFYKNKSMGLMSVLALKDASFTENELEILKLFGSLASLAIRKTQLYNEAKESLKLRELFISMAAHELRTPLTTINGYVQLLMSRLNKNTNEYRWVSETYREANRLKNLTDELLHVNRIQSGSLTYSLEVCSLREIINKVVTNFKITHPDRKIEFRDNLNGGIDTIVGDSDKLIQMLTNVVENALKYSQLDKEVIITLDLKKSQHYVVHIIDKGKGISKQDLPKIFEGFYRGENSTEQGMGIGLYLAKNIVDKHNGYIKIKSAINKGTDVEIRLHSHKVTYNINQLNR